jgi:hypothetical protein
VTGEEASIHQKQATVPTRQGHPNKAARTSSRVKNKRRQSYDDRDWNADYQAVYESDKGDEGDTDADRSEKSPEIKQFYACSFATVREGALPLCRSVLNGWVEFRRLSRLSLYKT